MEQITYPIQPQVYVGTLLQAYVTEGKYFWQNRIIGSIVLSRSSHITSPENVTTKTLNFLCLITTDNKEPDTKTTYHLERQRNNTFKNSLLENLIKIFFLPKVI